MPHDTITGPMGLALRASDSILLVALHQGAAPSTIYVAAHDVVTAAVALLGAQGGVVARIKRRVLERRLAAVPWPEEAEAQQAAAQKMAALALDVIKRASKR